MVKLKKYKKTQVNSINYFLILKKLDYTLVNLTYSNPR